MKIWYSFISPFLFHFTFCCKMILLMQLSKNLHEQIYDHKHFNCDRVYSQTYYMYCTCSYHQRQFQTHPLLSFVYLGVSGIILQGKQGDTVYMQMSGEFFICSTQQCIVVSHTLALPCPLHGRYTKCVHACRRNSDFQNHTCGDVCLGGSCLLQFSTLEKSMSIIHISGEVTVDSMFNINKLQTFVQIGRDSTSHRQNESKFKKDLQFRCRFLEPQRSTSWSTTLRLCSCLMLMFSNDHISFN